MLGGVGGRLGIALALLCLLSTCGGKPPPPPPVVQLTVVAAADVNPDETGQPAPVVVRIFQLSSATKFEQADFFQLADKEQATLGTDLIGRDEMVLSPGQKQALTINMKPDAGILGVTVAYRDIDHAHWRADIGVASTGTTKVAATLEKLSLKLEKPGQ